MSTYWHFECLNHTGFLTIGGSNVTATVRKLLLDSAAALEVSSGE